MPLWSEKFISRAILLWRISYRFWSGHVDRKSQRLPRSESKWIYRSSARVLADHWRSHFNLQDLDLIAARYRFILRSAMIVFVI